MRIIPYDGEENIEDLDTLGLLIKAIPFEGSFVAAYSMIAPDDNYFITIDEINALMDGVEIAREKLDELLAIMLQGKIAERLMQPDDDAIMYDQDKEVDKDDNGEGD
jgi:hypothetical protein